MKRSLSTRLRFAMFGVLLMFGVTFAISVVVITNKARYDYEVRESETIINGMADSVSSNIDIYKDISRMIMLNEYVITFLRSPEVDAGMINDARYGIYDVLQVYKDMDSVFIFRDDGAYMSTVHGKYDVDIDSIMDSEWQQPIAERLGGAYVGINGNKAIRRADGRTIITISRIIYDINSQRRKGMLMMNISKTMLDRIVRSEDSSKVCIMSDKGDYLSGNETLCAYFSASYTTGEIVHKQASYNDSEAMITGYLLEDMPILVMCVTTADFSAIPQNTMVALASLLIGFVASILLAGYFVSKNIARPISELTAAMEQTKNSGWMKSIDIDVPANEIGMLRDSYNRMIDYLKDLFEKLIDKEQSVRKNEMRVLQEQIKPHFLYNSLETIGCMALESGAESVHDAIETLGSFYRNFLSKGNREITLRREVSIIRDYIALAKLRYGDVLEDIYDIDEETLSCMVPKLILQPLVENSINHGIRMKGEPGIVKISCHLDGELLHIEVYDTGVGMTKEMIDSILSPESAIPPSPDDGENHAGFGLRGTIERVRYYYDSHDVVRIESVPGEYTKVEFTVPKMKRSE